ncbi:uncharacterized protein LOC109607011 [Aethina tumida]|uniref:uncharacterized protein LOC109607011 n=1 Tax=Aethina tumida TaxID=116153 RepID=UPI00096B4049|nr:uncharacterized protein LOC109607011 [Aethina tumida]
MVVPVDRMSSLDKTKKFVGNGLNITVKTNSRTTLVIGNNCNVDVEENLGSLRIIGDSCRVTVSKGNGRIDYVGNMGKIFIGDNVSDSVVTTVGNQIKVSSKKNHDCVRRSVSEKVFRTEAITPTANINICNSSKVHLSLSNLPSFVNGIVKKAKP